MKQLKSKELEELQSKDESIEMPAIKTVTKSNKRLFVLLSIIALIVFYMTRPVKIDITMSSSAGTVEYILDALDLDFNSVTSGATCLSGMQKKEFNTAKYGILYTEFTYCGTNGTTLLRVYNRTKDQILRYPLYGEVPKFDEYGKIIN